MLQRPQLLHQGSSCRAFASCCSSRRGLVCSRPTRCTAFSRQQLQVQCTGNPMDGSGPPPGKPGHDQKGAPPPLPKLPKNPTNTSWQTSKQASSPTGPGSTANKPVLGARHPPANPNTTTTTTVTTTTTSGAANSSSQPQPSTPASPASQAATGPNPPKPTPGGSTGPPPPSPGMGTLGPQPSSAQSNTTTATTTTTTVTYTTSTAPTSSTTTQLSPTQNSGNGSTGLIDWNNFKNKPAPRPVAPGSGYVDRSAVGSQQPGSWDSSQKAPRVPRGPLPPQSQAQAPQAQAPQSAGTQAAPEPAGRTRRELGGSYNLTVTSGVAVRFMLQGLDTLTRLPLAALLCGDPTTVRWFLMMFPLFMHESLVLVHKDDAAPTTLSVACVVAADPANVPVQAMSGQERYKLCSAPWTVNYFIGQDMRFAFGALGASKKSDGGSNYAWVARTNIVARCLQLLGGTVTDSQLRSVVSNSTLVLDAYALEAPDTKLPLAQQARLAVVPTMDANPKDSVVCWGLLKGQGQGQDKLLVAVVAGPYTDNGWRLEDIIRSTSTVQLKCGNDVVTLDPNRDVCVLGPRSYVTAQPKGTLGNESLALVGVWHDAGPSTAGGWHLYAQIKRYGRMGGAPTVLIGATQLYPLGPRANKYDSQPATSLVQALKVPEDRESYAVREARAMDEDWAIKDYPRFAAFDQPLAAYSAAVGSTHKVTDVQDTSPGSKDISNVYTTKLTEDNPDFKRN